MQRITQIAASVCVAAGVIPSRIFSPTWEGVHPDDMANALYIPSKESTTMDRTLPRIADGQHGSNKRPIAAVLDPLEDSLIRHDVGEDVRSRGVERGVVCEFDRRRRARAAPGDDLELAGRDVV